VDEGDAGFDGEAELPAASLAPHPHSRMATASNPTAFITV
jgi:hypothetical protein